jgi:uracil phosphoribosyltransferase
MGGLVAVLPTNVAGALPPGIWAYLGTMIHHMSELPGMAAVLVSELRDKEIQVDRMRFRHNLERLGECIAWDLAKQLSFQSLAVETPLGLAEGKELVRQPVLATILRAGLPMHQGFLRVFDRADCAYVSAYRKYHPGGDFEIAVEYVSSPDLTGRDLILIDPMLATGASIVQVYKALIQRGKPEQVHVVCAIASREGIQMVRKSLPAEVHIWAGAIDEETTARGYIVPGLGDAGDLAFGEKL